MTLFEQRFSKLLEFTDLQQSKRKAADNPWHRKEARGGDAMNQHQVAKRYQGRYTGEDDFTFRGELNNKIEMIRNGTSDMQLLSDVDCDHIIKNYPIGELSKDKPKKLSNTGMVVYWNPIKDSFVLKKQ